MASLHSLKKQFILLVVLLLMFLPCVYADRGGFSPRRERVSESGQKAIIAWNGTHEVLVLSTDVSSSRESEVVELMPLPANPTIRKGERQSFTKAEDLVNSYFAATSARKIYRGPFHYSLQSVDGGPPQVTITFQEIIGAHFLTVVRVEDAVELVQWLEDFLENNAYGKELPPNLDELLSYYMQIGMNFVVIDVIKTNSTIKTVDTLMYEFQSPRLYYPLRISSLFSGNTEISLFTITNSELDGTCLQRMKFVKKAQFQIKQEVLPEICANLTKLFSGNSYLCYFRFTGSLESFDGDILAGFRSDLNMPTLTAASLSLCLGFVFVLFFLPVNRTGFPLGKVNISVARRLEIASFLAGLLGLCLVLVGFLLPLGLVEFGKNGDMLITIDGIYVTSFEASDFLFLFFIAITIYSYVYLLIERNSKSASAILVIGGIYMLIQVLMSSVYLCSVGNGMYFVLLGCASVVSAGLLSFWRMKLTPTDITLTNKGTAFKTYIAKRLLTSIVTLVGVSLFIFLLWYRFRAGWPF